MIFFPFHFFPLKTFFCSRAAAPNSTQQKNPGSLWLRGSLTLGHRYPAWDTFGLFIFTGAHRHLWIFYLELLDDCSNSAGTYGSAALTDSETETLLHSYRMDQLDRHFYVITRHAHLGTSREFANACNVSCSEVELRTIVVEERCMTAALVFCQNVNLSCKFLMALYRTRFYKTLTSLDISSLNTTKQSADVVTSLSRSRSLRNISIPVTTVLRVSS